MHEIDVDAGKARAVGEVDGGPRRSGIVDAAEPHQRRVVEALHTNRQPVDAGGAKTGEASGVGRAGVRFKRDFGIGGDGEARVNARQRSGDGVRAEQARRAAPKENRLHLTTGPLRCFLVDVPQQLRDVLVFRQVAGQGVRVEIAVRAFAHAPGKVHVDRQRWQRGHRANSAISSVRRAAQAWPRWLSACLRAGGSCAAEGPAAETPNNGS